MRPRLSAVPACTARPVFRVGRKASAPPKKTSGHIFAPLFSPSLPPAAVPDRRTAPRKTERRAPVIFALLRQAPPSSRGVSLLMKNNFSIDTATFF